MKKTKILYHKCKQIFLFLPILNCIRRQETFVIPQQENRKEYDLIFYVSYFHLLYPCYFPSVLARQANAVGILAYPQE